MAFQHTAARRRLGDAFVLFVKPDPVSTHSRPKAAGPSSSVVQSEADVSTHSRPKAAGISGTEKSSFLVEFQHTAARRRLGNILV